MPRQIMLNDMDKSSEDSHSNHIEESNEEPNEESNLKYNLDFYELSSQNSLSEGMFDFPNNSNENDNQNALTGLNNQSPIANPQKLSQNSNEAIKSSSAQYAVSITTNINQKAHIFSPVSINVENATTKEKTHKKKRGRRKKGSTVTGGHTGNYPGNKLRKSITGCMDSIYDCLNERCKKIFS